MDGISFTVAETAPWTVNVKISKEAPFAVIAALVLSIIVGYLAAIIVIVIYQTRGSLKKKN